MCERRAGVCQFIHFTLRQMDAMSVNAAGAEQIVLRIDIEIIAVPGIETGDSSQFILVFCQMRLQMQVRPAAQQICRQRQLPWARRRGESRRDAVTQPLPAVPALDQIQAVHVAQWRMSSRSAAWAQRSIITLPHSMRSLRAAAALMKASTECACTVAKTEAVVVPWASSRSRKNQRAALRWPIKGQRFRGVDGMLQPVEQCFARRG